MSFSSSGWASDKPSTVSETINACERQIAEFPPEPHTPEQADKLSKIYALRDKLLAMCRAGMSKDASVPRSSSPHPDRSAASSLKREVIRANSPLVVGGSSGGYNRPTAATVASSSSSAGTTASSSSAIPSMDESSLPQYLDKERLIELVKEIDPFSELEPETHSVLLHVADDFIESVVTAACKLAKHRGSSTLEAQDVALILEKQWNIFVPGQGLDVKPHKKSSASDAHKARMAAIRRATKR